MFPHVRDQVLATGKPGDGLMMVEFNKPWTIWWIASISGTVKRKHCMASWSLRIYADNLLGAHGQDDMSWIFHHSNLELYLSNSSLLVKTGVLKLGCHDTPA